jgi:tetratricopeptide (TPR) repeat protein
MNGMANLRALVPPGRRTVALIVVLVLAAGGTAAALVTWRVRRGAPEDSAASHWQSAGDALAADDLERAQFHLRRCLETWPLNGEVHFLLARVCRRGDDSLGWQDYFQKAALLGWSKEALEFEALLMRAQAGDLRRVGPLLAGLIDGIHPERALVFEAVVKGSLATHRINDAIHWASVWLEHYPDQPSPWLARGRAYELRGSWKSAVADYQRAVALRPDDDRARLLLAEALVRDQQFQPAREQFQKFLCDHPDDASSLYGLANCQWSLGDTAAAQTALDELFARHPNHAMGMFLRGRLELHRGSAAEAVVWLKQAEALAPHEPDIAYTCMLAYQQLGRAEEVRHYKEKTERLRQGQDRLAQVRKEIRADPDNVSLLHEAGMVCLELGQSIEAAYWFKNVLLLDPNHRPTHAALAEQYRKEGDSQRAEHHRRLAGDLPNP